MLLILQFAARESGIFKIMVRLTPIVLFYLFSSVLWALNFSFYVFNEVSFINRLQLIQPYYRYTAQHKPCLVSLWADPCKNNPRFQDPLPHSSFAMTIMADELHLSDGRIERGSEWVSEWVNFPSSSITRLLRFAYSRVKKGLSKYLKQTHVVLLMFILKRKVKAYHFLWKGYLFCQKRYIKGYGWWVWISGRSIPIQNFVEYPPPRFFP